MLTITRPTTVEDIINDGEYSNEVKDYIKSQLENDSARKLALFNEWIVEAGDMGDTEAVEYFKGMTDMEKVFYMDLDEIIDFYAESSLSDFAYDVDIDWTGLAESFGIE